MTEKEYKRLHTKVKAALKKAKKTRSIPAIALDTEISDGALRRIENGDTLRPRASTLEVLGKYFGRTRNKPNDKDKGREP